MWDVSDICNFLYGIHLTTCHNSQEFVHFQARLHVIVNGRASIVVVRPLQAHHNCFENALISVEK